MRKGFHFQLAVQFSHLPTNLQSWGVEVLVVWFGWFFLMRRAGRIFFSHPFLQGKLYFGLFFSWAKCFSNNGLIFLYKRMNLGSELDRWQLIAFQILILFKTTWNILKAGNILHHARRNSGITNCDASQLSLEWKGRKHEQVEKSHCGFCKACWSMVWAEKCSFELQLFSFNLWSTLG